MHIHPEIRKFFRVITFPLLFGAVLWLVWLLDEVFDLNLYKCGVLPRTARGMTGILFSPLIHSNVNHLASNSLPLLILGVIMFAFYREIAFKVFFIVYFSTGICVWLFGRAEAYHIGASGLIYGFVCFLFYSGLFRKNRRLIALSLLVTFMYGSLIFGVLPFRAKKISWESHLVGAITGGIAAFFLRKKGPENDHYDWQDEPDEKENSYKLDITNIKLHGEFRHTALPPYSMN